MDYVKQFKDKISELTGNSHSYHRLREVESNKTIEISYRCFRYYSKCKSKCTVVLDLNNLVAHVYQSDEKHNHRPGYALRNFKV